MNILKCADYDCDKDGVYHIQTTEYDHWLCRYHMKESWKQTQLCNLFRSQLQNPRMVKCQ